jgi:DNA processing protein
MSDTEQLPLGDDTSPAEVFQPAQEITAYEALWAKFRSVPKMAELFKKYGHALPTFIATREGLTEDHLLEVRERLREILPFSEYGALFYRDFEYPHGLRSAKHPVEVLYYQGDAGLLSAPAVSVVGARKASPDGIRRAKKLAHLLVKHRYIVMSGLAEGVDAAAHQQALDSGGRTVAVIGTSLNESYPKSNKALQARISKDFLLVSQVPLYFSSIRDYRQNRLFFPERNKTMSALSLATVIVEASDTSGTLIQARAAVEQGRKLFILKSCFERGLTWPAKFLTKGAVKVSEIEEILEHLPIVPVPEAR